MSFFLKKRTNRTAVVPKRKKKVQKSGEPVKKPAASTKHVEKDVDIPSDSDDEGNKDEGMIGDVHLEEELNETAEERKLRLAKKYLEEIEIEEKERLESQEIDKSLIEDRLEDEAAVPHKKEKQKFLADKIQLHNVALVDNSEATKHLKNGHKLSVTCVRFSPDGSYVFSGGKEGAIIKWCLQTKRKVKIIPAERKGQNEKRLGHSGPVSAIAISTSGKFLATAGPECDVRIWNSEDMSFHHRFEGHRAQVTGLAFRRSTHSLYSCGKDRIVKVWNVDELMYVEDLFGHQDPITAIDSLFRERCITAGGRDSTLRVWKIPEESQLVFQGTNGQSIDCVKFLTEQHFVSGGEDGCISLWGLLKKKPLSVYPNAHGIDPSSQQPNWITCLAAHVNSDLFASGSCDGFVRLWKSASNNRRIEPLFTIPVKGFVNDLDFSSGADALAVAVGQEHRLGRWWRLKEARNQIIVVPLERKE